MRLLLKKPNTIVEKGKIGCVQCKENLLIVLKRILEPMNERRSYYLNNKDEIWDILLTGTGKAKIISTEIIKEVRESMKISYCFS